MEHLIAKGVDRAIQYVHRRRMEAQKGAGAPFVVEGNRQRFAAVASMVAGREIDVVNIRGDTPPRPYWPVLYRMAHPALLPEHGFGWSDGEKLFFPVSVVEMDSETAREEITKTLLFFLSFQVRCGTLEAAWRNRSMLASDRLTADLFWIIENTRLHCEIRREYPGAVRGWARITGHLLKSRPAARYLTDAEKKVEGFLRESLEGTLLSSADGLRVSGSAEESLGMAAGMKRKWAARGVNMHSEREARSLLRGQASESDIDASLHVEDSPRLGRRGSFKAGRYRAIVPFFPWGKLVLDRIKHGGSLAPAARAGKEATPSPAGEGSAKEGKPRRGGRYAARTEGVDEKANENGLTLNIYDKILSWAEFVNVRRPFDDDPDQDAGTKADECEELSMAELDRTTANTFNAEIEKADSYTGAGDEAGEIDEESFLYPEWDYRRRAYRDDYSRLTETLAVGEDAGFCARVLREKRGAIKEVTRNLGLISPSVRLTRRQIEGTTIDLNAAVDAIADLEAGHTPDERLYAAYTKTERDLSALFLVDLSMSTDGWAGDTRIIDHEKESLLILCEALEKLRDRYAVYGFSGKTRKGCRFFRIKGFTESYGDGVRKRIGGLIPYSYTRMGPAVRHAAGILAKEQARTRLLFILSDGKPNDVDVYEGRYGIEDTRMAIKEAESAGIVPFCLTVDTGAGDYLPRLFGHGNYAVVPGVDMLAKKLPSLYAKIIQKL
ncbi:MAG: hypothetical protein HZB22_09020 [Deltaproteobacteria bacterium]|nr:hypothetical protein [Deltaproteobacteria bacterium]